MASFAQVQATILLLLSIMAVWLPVRWLWKLLFCAFIVTGYVGGILTPLALISMGALALLVYVFYQVAVSPWIKFLVLFAVLGLALALALHSLPGFSPWEIYPLQRLSDKSAPFSVWISYEKPLIGLFVLAALSSSLNKTKVDWASMFSRMWKTCLMGIAVVYLLAYGLGYARFDLTFTTVFIPWAIKNLFFVVIAEEAYFRGLIQQPLQQYIKHDKAGLIAVVIAGALFGLAHIAGGYVYAGLSAVAGMFYGYVYYRTKRIEAAIAMHFLLNVGHFLFFTYPYYQS